MNRSIASDFAQEILDLYDAAAAKLAWSPAVEFFKTSFGA